jgi:hypothetical protein
MSDKHPLKRETSARRLLGAIAPLKLTPAAQFSLDSISAGSLLLSHFVIYVSRFY